MKRQGLAAGVMVLSTLCHSLAFARILATIRTFPFGAETLICVGLAYGGSVCSFLIDSPRVFGPIHAMQGSLTFVAVAMLAAKAGLLEALLVMPFIAATSIYLSARRALAVAGIFATAVIASDYATLHPSGAPNALFHVLSVFIVMGGTATFGCLLTFYREDIVEKSALIRQLDAAVADLATANRAFQDYADTIESASKDDERNRITRELHDTIGYALTNLIMMMNAGKTLAQGDTDRLEELFDNARLQADSALHESRAILYRLRSITNAPRKGLQALEHLVRSFHAATGVEVTVHYGNVPWSYGEHIDVAIFRLIQEGLTNSFRHGRARTVRIMLWQTETEIRIRVWDSGRGAKAIKDGIGLSGMKERFADLGGGIDAHSVVDGFVLDGFIPMAGGPRENA